MGGRNGGGGDGLNGQLQILDESHHGKLAQINKMFTQFLKNCSVCAISQIIISVFALWRLRFTAFVANFHVSNIWNKVSRLVNFGQFCPLDSSHFTLPLSGTHCLMRQNWVCDEMLPCRPPPWPRERHPQHAVLGGGDSGPAPGPGVGSGRGGAGRPSWLGWLAQEAFCPKYVQFCSSRTKQSRPW